MIIVDGKSIANKILNKIKSDLNGQPVSLPRRQAGIAAIWVGEDLAIGRFVEMKKKYAESIGIKLDIYHFENNVTEAEIINKISKLSADGIIVELPLPENLNRDEILNSIPKTKDIDVLSASAQKDFYNNQSKILPPAVGALKILFEEYKINPKDKVAAVFGQSILIGKPISYWLEQNGAKVFRVDENTENAGELCLQSDIVISGVGKPNLISGNMIKPGAIVVDFGFEKLGSKISGDVDFDSVAPKSSIITPVPGGMGPILIAAFLENALMLYLASMR